MLHYIASRLVAPRARLSSIVLFRAMAALGWVQDNWGQLFYIDVNGYESGECVNLYLLLAIAPIIYGAYGLRTGRLPVSSKRCLVDADARRYSIIFILFSVAIVILTVSLAVCARIIDNAELLGNISSYVLLIGLPLGLAIILDRATKQARRSMYKTNIKMENKRS